jgi:hypothetical protein
LKFEYYSLNQNLKTFFYFLFLSAAQNHFGPIILAAHVFFLFSLRTGPIGIRPSRPLRPTRESSPTSISQAAFGLAGAAASLAVVSRPPERVRSRNDAPPGHLLFPHTNSMPRRLPSPYYSSKPAELSSTEPPPDYSPTASLPPFPPYKSHPRAPSPHHLTIPCFGSLHPHPYCTPTKLGPPPLCLTVARPNRAAPAPTNAVVRFPSVPSFSRCFRGELPPFVAATRHTPVSVPPRPGRESTVDRPE